LGQFWAVLQWMKSVNFTAIPSILLPFSIFYGHFAYFVVILHILWSFWYIFPFWYVVPNKIWQPWSRIGSIGFKNWIGRRGGSRTPLFTVSLVDVCNW
jgi:hypothetical protein